MSGPQGVQQVANTECVDIGIIGNRHHFMRDRIQGTEDIKSLSPRGGVDKEPLKAPEESEKRLQNKMRRVDEIHVLATLLGVR